MYNFGTRERILACSLTFLAILGCMPRERTGIEKGAEDAPVASENAGPLAFAALAYRGAVGAWPASVEDLEEFYGGPAFELDWRELRDALFFEELCDGRLRITPTNPSSHFILTLDVPAKREDEGEGDNEE